MPTKKFSAKFEPAYEAKKYEEKTYHLWEKSGAFNPDNLKNTRGRYTNIMPPPNANGELHLGHAWGYTVMDLLGRFNRMNGKKTLLLPGKDHAGIQSQVTFENLLKKERGVTRHQLGRQKFFEEIYTFTTGRAKYMRAQEKRIGISADWSREKFTLDPAISTQVLTTFVKMYNDGLIYQGNRIINWCSRCASAISDLEVEHQNLQGRLWYIKYSFTDGKGDLTVATTRPETMLGDTALAVNPNDKRYQRFVGRTVVLPLVGRAIPVIADPDIDPTFGTGVVKVTPAHDPVDFMIGERHKLAQISIFDVRTGRTSEHVPQKYRGFTMLEARKRVLADLQDEGFLVKEENHQHSVGHCERCKTVVEPLVSKQWFINVDHPNFSLKKRSLDLIRSGKIKIYPERFEKTFYQWFENLHDWTISRQIWWGHQIPVYYCAHCKEVMVQLEKPTACTRCGKTKITQDPNTLDTWFSSGQWAYTTLGYQHDLPLSLQSEDFQNFYPSDVMVMGRDILFFWASRMIMMSLYVTDQIPFRNLYFTGLLRDKAGKKMSKSKGNGIDVLQMIDQYGADALRLAVTMGSTPGNDNRMYEEKIVGFRNFINKLWNVARFVSLQSAGKKSSKKSIADTWILSRLERLRNEVTSDLEKFHIGEAGQKLYDFLWHDFADWYLEVKKIEQSNMAVAREVLAEFAVLAHPFIPFVTEVLWQKLGNVSMLMTEKWPTKNTRAISAKTEKIFARLQEVVTVIRSVRANYKIAPTEELEVVLPSRLPKQLEKIVLRLARVVPVKTRAKKGMISRPTPFGVVAVLLANKIDIDKELTAAANEEEALVKYIVNTQVKLENKAFVNNAPKEVVVAVQQQEKDLKAKLRAIRIHKKEVLKLKK